MKLLLSASLLAGLVVVGVTGAVVGRCLERCWK